MVTASSCVSCGACKTDCPLTGSLEAFQNSDIHCRGCGECVDKCPYAFRKISGKTYTPKELADAVMKNSVFLTDGGGVTFSGGEPTMQSEFLLETMALLPLHKAIQTCGQCNPETFKRILDAVDFLFFDIKHTDTNIHKRYTGTGNEMILKNLIQVKESEKPFIARIPLIKGVNDSVENLNATAELLKHAKGLQGVELLPYNGATGAKYPMTGIPFTNVFSAPALGDIDITPFTEANIKCRIM
jgi:pyruvate formate lyase activating enzyme